ncbi:M20/M25/M40 family metallo-hydrolase [Sodalis praecaptivus]|uniref:M20/M25/M40 family metallo-hydrolase n=1 Tax=Sodalis praecaptivus TaxID=1239307 RepID=UPI0027F19222|nr:M20/M25/M40 family metallo-hydrolase [Sodalis praecaptivus]CAJ0995171.1 N-carbamoyl-L-amino-acid hydrolase [Sodalis praecaptivus]
MMHIDEERVLASLRRLATFGAEGRGVSRPALSAADMAARRWLAEEMAGAGLEPTLDAVGNLYGRQPNVTQALLLGSHADSVPNGGWLDGALGVIYGIEVARAWHQAYPDAATGIDVIAFSDEEGRFLSCLGSRSFCDRLSPAEFDALVNNNPSLSTSITAAALPTQPFLRLDPARHLAYLEAHI